LAYAARLSVYGKDEQQRKLAARFVEYILRRAEEAGKEVYEKAKEIIEEGKARGSLTLKGLEKEVEVDGRRHKVRSDYTITYSRRGARNEAVGHAYVSADAPGGRKAGAERFAAVVKALTGREPRIIERSNGKMEVECGRGHLDGFACYAELAEAIEKWLEETSR
jgi:hypothetical protein